MPTLTPASADSLTLAPVVDGGGYAGFYPSSSTYPSSSLYPGIEETGTSSLAFGAAAGGTVTGSADSAGSFFAIPGIDILENGDFEIGTLQWRGANGTVSQDTTHVYHGKYAAKCVTNNTTASEGFELATTAPPTVTTNLVPLPAGPCTILLAFYAYGDGVAHFRGHFDLYDSSLTFIRNTNSGIITPPAAWTRYTATRNVTDTNAVWANIRFLTDTQQLATFWIDNITFSLQNADLTLTPA